MLSWWSCQSAVTHSCSLLNHGNGFCGGMSKLNTKFHADLLLYSVILNAMATQYTCSLTGVYHPHQLAQWSRHCSHMHSPVHCPWLPGYIHVMQTVHVILQWLDFFQPHILKVWVLMFSSYNQHLQVDYPYLVPLLCAATRYPGSLYTSARWHLACRSSPSYFIPCYWKMAAKHLGISLSQAGGSGSSSVCLSKRLPRNP